MKNDTAVILNCLFLVSLTLLCACSSVPQHNLPDITMNERFEWCDIWHNDADKQDLPRVLFIGDSITRGYFHKTANRLKGKAYCSYLCTSTCAGNPLLTQQIKLVLSQYDYRVIHFNNGLHGPSYSADQYRTGLQETIELLQQESDATVIWGAITPHKENKGHALVDARNAIAQDIAARYGLAINDLHTPMMGKDDYYKDGTHFNAEGVELQARQNAEMVLHYLE